MSTNLEFAREEMQSVPTLRRQLQQLEELRAGGGIDSDAYERSKTALERRVLALVMRGDPGVDAPRASGEAAPVARPSRKLLAGLSAVVVVLAVAGYASTGSPAHAGFGAGLSRPAGAAAAGAEPVVDNAHAVSPEQIKDMTDKLARRLKDAPGDAEGWAMLARSYSVLGRRAEAVPAYERAVALRADDASLLVDYADALAVNNQGRLTGAPMALVTRALKLDPTNLKALSLAGTDAFDRKQYAAAMGHWENVVKLGAPDNPLVDQARAGIAEARALGELPPAAAASAAAPSAVAGVSGTVAIAPALAGRAAPGDTVFVFARAVEGSRMPLAVLRKQVRDLPFEFKLDDSMAMTGAGKLSSAKRVVVGVRVSKTGDAVPAAGDLVGQSAPLTVGASGIHIDVASVVAR